MDTGAVDAEGLPHGRGTLTLGKRARFEGRMAHGSRDGVGCLIVDEGASDSEDGDAHFLARERNKRLCRGRADASDLSSSEEEYETLVLGETQEATLERVRRELQAKQAQYDSLLRAMEDAPPAVL